MRVVQQNVAVHIFVHQCTKSYVNPKGMNRVGKLTICPETDPVPQTGNLGGLI